MNKNINPNEEIHLMSEQLEDQGRGLKKASQIMSITHIVLICVTIIVGGALAYLNAVMVNRDDFDNYKTYVDKETEALVEKQSLRLGVELGKAVSPMVVEISSMNKKLDEKLTIFSTKINALEKDIYETTNIVSNGQLVRATEFFTYQRDSLQEVQGVKNELLRTQLDVKNLESLRDSMGEYITQQQHEDFAHGQRLELDSISAANMSLSFGITEFQKDIAKSVETIEEKIARMEDAIYKRR